jgi:hypothetical protein
MQDDPTNYNDFIASSARLQATFAILDDIHKREEKALIFVEYLKMQSILSEIIGRRYNRKVMIINGAVSGAKRKARIDEFQREKTGFDVMILSPKAGGVGLNLTAATHVIHLSRWWNPAVEDQCSDRAYRIGQTKPVTIHYPLAIHPEYGRDYSFDKKLHDLLEKKRRLSHTLLAPPAGTEADIEWLYAHSVERRSESSNENQYSDDEILPREKDNVDLERIDLMEPIEFENWVLKQFSIGGYETKTTLISGDAGADGLAIAPPGSGKPHIILQCKHTQRDTKITDKAVKMMPEFSDNSCDLIQKLLTTLRLPSSWPVSGQSQSQFQCKVLWSWVAASV